MARPTKLTYEIQQRIDDNIALGLPYLLPLKLPELRIRHFTTGTRKAKIQNLENTLNSINLFKSVTQMPLKNVLNVYNESTKAGNCQVCMWILERRFPEDFTRRQYRKMNIVSENKNENVEITIKEADILRKKILAKFDRF